MTALHSVYRRAGRGNSDNRIDVTRLVSGSGSCEHGGWSSEAAVAVVYRYSRRVFCVFCTSREDCGYARRKIRGCGDAKIIKTRAAVVIIAAYRTNEIGCTGTSSDAMAYTISLGKDGCVCPDGDCRGGDSVKKTGEKSEKSVPKPAHPHGLCVMILSIQC